MAKILRTDGQEVESSGPKNIVEFFEMQISQMKSITNQRVAKLERLIVLCKNPEALEAIEILNELNRGPQ